MSKPTKIQTRRPKPGSAEWKRQRNWLLTRGALSATGTGQSVRMNIWLPDCLNDAVRSLAAYFKVPLAVFVRAAVRELLDARGIAN